MSYEIAMLRTNGEGPPELQSLNGKVYYIDPGQTELHFITTKFMRWDTLSSELSYQYTQHTFVKRPDGRSNPHHFDLRTECETHVEG